MSSPRDIQQASERGAIKPAGTELSATSKDPTTLPAPTVGEVLECIVQQIATAHNNLQQRRIKGDVSALLSAVDVEVTLRNITTSENGWVLFGKDSQESQMEIKLATRILPPDSD
jgi:hypothetical protein